MLLTFTNFDTQPLIHGSTSERPPSLKTERLPELSEDEQYVVGKFYRLLTWGHCDGNEVMIGIGTQNGNKQMGKQFQNEPALAGLH